MRFSKLPILACQRNRAGIITDITDRLAEANSTPRRKLIGRHACSIWPHGRPWLVLDRAALRQKSPLVRLEYCERSGRWLQTTRCVDRGRVVWFGEDATAVVKVAGISDLLKSLTGPSAPVAVRPLDQAIARAATNGATMGDVAQVMGLTVEQFAGSCIRLARS